MRRTRYVIATSACMLLVAACGVASDQQTDDVAPALAAPERAAAAQQAGSTCIMIRRGSLGTVNDTQIASNPDAAHPLGNFGANLAMISGKVGAGIREALISFDLNLIPPGSSIDSASLVLQARPDSVADPLHRVNLHRSDVGWFESAVTWDSFYVTSYPFDPTYIFDSELGGPGTIAFNATSLVSDWLANGNGGVVLEQGGTHYTNFYTSEDPTAANRPALDVCFTAPPCTPGTDISVTDSTPHTWNGDLYIATATRSGYLDSVVLNSQLPAGSTDVDFTFSTQSGLYNGTVTVNGPGPVTFAVPAGQALPVTAGQRYSLFLTSFASDSSFTSNMSCTP